MINLLPADDKKQMAAARANVLLLRYNFLMLGVVAFLAVAVGFTYYYLNGSLAASKQTIADNTQKEASYNKVKTDATQFRQQLTDAKSLFDSETNYSALLLNISREIPSGAVIGALQLSDTTFTTPLQLTVDVQGEHQAAEVRDNFQKSPNFTNVTVGTVSKGTTPGYPYAVTYNISVNRSAAK